MLGQFQYLDYFQYFSTQFNTPFNKKASLANVPPAKAMFKLRQSMILVILLIMTVDKNYQQISDTNIHYKYSLQLFRTFSNISDGAFS